ncbi:MAG TPA: TonB-dependent receptor [Vicinamibacterales bacterium]|nr:TonB-dependent receptor [Vicinamibacterales bacterium]
MIPVLLCVLALAGANPVSGVVRDSSGAVVAGATVVVRAGTEEARTITGPDGRFTVDAPGGSTTGLRVIVRAAGFAEQHAEVADGRELDIVLAPASLVEAVTVTASRDPISSDTPAAASVLTADMLQALPAPMLDDQLKIVPGFGLFRRSSSRVANPTTQGVTMRGLSASGASRSLVLVDGVPLNDPFGGWIYWDRIPQTALDRVEVVRGGTSDAYGANAVGGVIQVLTRPAGRPSVRASAEIASRSTPRLSMYGGAAHDGWSGFASGEWQTTDGFVIVKPQENPAAPSPNLRGPVDIAANSEYKTFYGGAGYQAGAWRAGIRAGVFRETRGNGTPLTNNDTSSHEVSGEASGTAAGGFWQARAYGGSQDYHQSFSAVTAVNSLRTTESLTQTQFVPAKNAGFNAQWTGLAGRTTWSAGADTARTEGRSDETAYSRGVPTSTASNGGVQWDTGAFGRASWDAVNDLTVVGSVRLDRWTSTPTNPSASSAAATEVSPKAGATWRASSRLVFHGFVTHAYRTPTLNELFRSFRAGGSLTSANDRLTPETLTAAEGGATLRTGANTLRAVVFFNDLNDAITNVTVSTTPTLITRQRRNAGTIHATGLDLDDAVSFGPHLHATFGAELVRSRFVDALEPGLAGNKVSQVPPVGLSASVRADVPAAVTVNVVARYNSTTFDDDRNTLPLSRVSVVDAYVARSFGRAFQAFVAVENLFDDVYDVGNTPLITIGLPRTFRAGVRAFLP